MENEEKKQLIEALYQMYPRREGKNDGVRKLDKLIKSVEDFEMFKKCIENYKKKLIVEKTEKRYTLMFSTFINGRYLDYVSYDDDVVSEDNILKRKLFRVK